MASKYIQKFPTPEGFPEILHDLAKEILRNQPADILEFSALYFKCLQEGTVLDYANRGQNIPCDFKTGVPTISERPQRKKPLNEKDEALHSAAVENSVNIAKKPMTPDLKLIEADSGNLRGNNKENNPSNSNNNTAENLISDLRGKSNTNKNVLVEENERKHTEKSVKSNAGSIPKNKIEEEDEAALGKREIDSAHGSRKSEMKAQSRTSINSTMQKEIAVISEKFLDDVLKIKTQEPEKGLDEHINNKLNKNIPNKNTETAANAENNVNVNLEQQENIQENPIPQTDERKKTEENTNNEKTENNDAVVEKAEEPQAMVINNNPEEENTNTMNNTFEEKKVDMQKEPKVEKPELESTGKLVQEGLTRDSAIVDNNVHVDLTPESEINQAPENEINPSPAVEENTSPEAEAIATPEAEANATPEAEAIASPEA